MKKQILVFGASGFLASNFIHKYKKKYKIISSIKSKKKSKNKLFKGTKIIIENITNKKINFYSNNRIDFALYTIALGSMESIKKKNLSYKINFESIKKFCKILKKNNIKNVIKISTIKVYGNYLNCLITEEQKPNPKDNYSFHICKADEYLKKFCQENDIKFYLLRVPNGFGIPIINSKETGRILINNFVKQALQRRKIRIHSKIDLTKEYVSINNIIESINFIINKKKLKSGIYLLSNNFSRKLSQVAKKIKDIFKTELNKKIEILDDFTNKKTNLKFKVSSVKIRKAGLKSTSSELNDLKKLILNFKI